MMSSRSINIQKKTSTCLTNLIFYISGFSNLVAASVYPSVFLPSCVMQGQGYTLTGMAPEGNIQQIYENIDSASECGKIIDINIQTTIQHIIGEKCKGKILCTDNQCINDHVGWTYANKFTADQALRFTCWCLSEDNYAKELQPRFGMDSGLADCPN